MAKKILITGAAGFIGAALAHKLLLQGEQVLGVDNLNSYYDVALKEARLARIASLDLPFQFIKMDIADTAEFHKLYANYKPHYTLHMAAQAGVRFSMEQPFTYLDSNVKGTLNVLEAGRHFGTEHIVFASSSSVYGANALMPNSVVHATEHPVSLYAATKKAGEMMAHSYSHLYRIPLTGLRFFTVYGPWGRPDMAAFSFTRKILNGEPISVFNHGHHRRDFTYIEDIVEGVCRVMWRPAVSSSRWDALRPNPSIANAPYRIYNIGNQRPVLLSEFIATLERVIGRKAVVEMQSLQPGDVGDTFADVGELESEFGFAPNTSLEAGLRKFYDWYQSFYARP